MTTPRAARCSGVRAAVGVAAGGGLGRKWKTTGRPDAEVKTKGKWFWALDCWLLPALATLAHRFNLFFKATDRREAGRAVKNNLTIMLKERQLIHGKRAKGGNDGKGGAKPQQSGFQKRDKLFGIWHVVDWLFFWQSYGWWLAVSIVAIICKAVSTPFRRRPFISSIIISYSTFQALQSVWGVHCFLTLLQFFAIWCCNWSWVAGYNWCSFTVFYWFDFLLV